MEYYLIAALRVTHQNEGSLTYHGPTGLVSGTIVRVTVGAIAVPGIVLSTTEQPDFTTKPIDAVIETSVLPSSLIALHAWIKDYYGAHPVATWQAILPKGLGKSRRKNVFTYTLPHRNSIKIVLNSEQQASVEVVQKRLSGTTMLYGVTGSGKTHVYIELTKRAIQNHKSVIVLVPEIALTSQIIADFIPYFPDLIVSHSQQTEAERHIIWRQIASAKTPRVIIGPRSALFSPLNDLGLIIIDECHEPSFKQEQAPRYSALRVASTLARITGARLVMGSATPPIADYYLAHKTDTPIAVLKKPARKDTVPPDVTLIDMTKKIHFTRQTYLSNSLIDAIEKTLATGQQSLLFHNRRGSAPTTLCDNCGWNALCFRCFVPLTLHADSFSLVCHICNARERVPTVCPECHNASIIHKGIGTKRIEEDIRRLFPHARTVRFDGDSSNTQSLAQQYQALYDGTINIIIGTQVIAKGLDLPNLRMVGVIQADSGLSLPDYTSEERVFQLLAQVCGRVGRNEHPSRVIVQSYQPTSPSVQFGIKQDYIGFYDHAIQERHRAQFPPFVFLLKLTCIYKTESAAIRASTALARKLRRNAPLNTIILGPTPAFYERTRETYRWQIIVKAKQRSCLLEILQYVPRERWQIDIDPASLL